MQQASNPVPNILKPPPPPPPPPPSNALSWIRNNKRLEDAFRDLLHWAEQANAYTKGKLGSDEIEEAKAALEAVRSPNRPITGNEAEIIDELAPQRYYFRKLRDCDVEVVPSQAGAWVKWDCAAKLLRRLKAAERKLAKVTGILDAIAADDMTRQSMVEAAQNAIR